MRVTPPSASSHNMTRRLRIFLMRWRVLIALLMGGVVLLLTQAEDGAGRAAGPVIAIFAGGMVYAALSLLTRIERHEDLSDALQRASDRNTELTLALEREREHCAELTLALEMESARTAELNKQHAAGTVQSSELQALQQRMGALNDRLLHINQELDTVGRTKGEFMARMSHELRTPLNAIVGYTELVLDGMYGGLSDKQRDRLERVLRNGRNLLGLINDILDLAEIEAGRLELNFADVRVENALQLALASVERQATDKGLAIELTVEDDLPPISVDELRLRQMIVHLLDNAVKFTEQGKIRVLAGFVHVERSGAALYPHLKPGNWLVVRVADSGIGIPPELHDKIFEDFVQADTSATRAYGGSGLGLTITRRIVEMHGGKIWLESAPGKGATFTLALPYDGIADDTITAPSGLVHDPLILIVDDEEHARETIANHLIHAGYRVACVDSGVRALKRAAKVHPDVILLDLLMPDMDGWQVLEQLQADVKTNMIGVVTISIMDQKQRALTQGALGHVAKPIERAELLTAVAKAVMLSAKLPILIAEANDVTRSTFTAVVRMGGHQTCSVDSASAAIDWLRRQRARLVIIGVQHADDDMNTLLDFMQTHPPSAAIPALVVAADTSTAEALRAQHSNRAQILQKRGLGLDALLTSIDRVLDNGK